MEPPLTSEQVRSVAGPDASGRLYLTQWDTTEDVGWVYVSDDFGCSWERGAAVGGSAPVVHTAPWSAWVYVVDGLRLFRSADGGATFEETSLPGWEYLMGGWVLGVGSEDLYVWHDEQLLTSADQGETWSEWLPLPPDAEPPGIDASIDPPQVSVGGDSLQVWDGAAWDERPVGFSKVGRIGDRAHAARVQKHLVVPPQLDVLERPSAAHHVVREGQDVVRLVVRLVDGQDLDASVDPLDQSGSAYHLVHRAQAAMRHRRDPVRELVRGVSPAMWNRVEDGAIRATDRSTLVNGSAAETCTTLKGSGVRTISAAPARDLPAAPLVAEQPPLSALGGVGSDPRAPVPPRRPS